MVWRHSDMRTCLLNAAADAPKKRGSLDTRASTMRLFTLQLPVSTARPVASTSFSVAAQVAAISA